MPSVLNENDRKPAVPRLDGIDILRGLSIRLAVILLHILIRFAGQHVRIGWDWPKLHTLTSSSTTAKMA